jgi:hypothetical protein
VNRLSPLVSTVNGAAMIVNPLRRVLSGEFR